LDWGGPLTSQLTDHIRNTGFTVKNSSQKLTDYIYQTLLKNEYDKSEVNFETIINVIEELAIYFSEFNGKKQTPSLLRTFVTGDEIKEVFDFGIKGGQRKHGYSLEIPEGREYVFSNYALNNENPYQFYLQHLISGILSEISGLISEYAYHTKSHSVVDTNSENSSNFQKWMTGIQPRGTLRLYTLNYDRVFKILLDNAGIDSFEGFYSTGEVDDLKGLRCDIKRIIEDQTVNVHYNLHGSAFWKVIPSNSSQLPSPEIVYTGIPNLQLNDEIANLQIEKGKPIYLTNIITGYQKAQKSLLSPFKQMQFSFERDCMATDKLYVLGYSFGDEHINQCLKTALRYNMQLKIEIVDPDFIKNKMDHQLSLTLFQYLENEFIAPRKVGDNKYIYFGGIVTLYTLKFNEYLKLMVAD
jgi:hypothetical protein